MPKGFCGFQKGNKLGKKFESREKHWNWQGKGYKLCKSGNGKTVYKRVKVKGMSILEHRHIMEKYLGRKLDLRKEVIHHLNGNGTDNRLENLQLISRGDHNRLHGNQYGSNYVRH